MNHHPSLTGHAHERITARKIPPGVIEIILAYGRSRSTGDGVRKHGLSRDSFREIRKTFGPEIAKAFAGYRDVYVVANDGRVITVARARHPLFQ